MGCRCNVQISAMIPAGHIAIVEFFTAAGSDDFFPGANPDQTGDSYLWSPGCHPYVPYPVLA